MRSQRHNHSGFTLIELMIVIAIVGILAAIALPAYQDYIVRAKMAEPLSALAEVKTTVSEYLAVNGQYPATVEQFGVEFNVLDGDIVFALGIGPQPLVNGETVYIGVGVYSSVWEGGEPDVSSFSVFSLSGSTNPDGTMTWECVTGFPNAAGPDLEMKYLPANCRG